MSHVHKKNFFVCVQYSNQIWTVAPAWGLHITNQFTTAAVPSEAEPRPVQQYALHTRNACA